jgi:hypothetical protein
MTSYILEAKPWNPVTNALAPINFATGIPDEAALGQTLPYILRLRDSFTHEVSVFADNIPGSNQASIGSLVLNNVDGLYDFLLDYAWGGREIVVKTAPEGSPYSAYTLLFTGSAIDIAGDRSDLTLTLRDNSWKLVTPLQKNKFLGTGGSEGGRETQGQNKPLSFGLVKNITPVLIDSAFPTYQFHDGAVEGVIAVYDDGVPIVPVADYPTYEALVAATIGKGGYGTCIAQGFVRLGAPPAGTLTLDVQGQFYSAVNLSETVRQILLSRSPLTAGELVSTDFEEFAADFPGRVSGIYYQVPDEDLDATMETLLGTGNAFWFFGADGRFRVRQYKFREPSARVRAEDIAGLQRSFSAKPLYSVVVNYDRNLTVQEVSSFSLAANTLNSYLDESVVWVQTNADGSGGDWSNVRDQIHAYLGSTEINDLKIADFQEVSPVSWASVDTNGLVYITDPGSNTASVELRTSLDNYYATNKLTVRKILGPSGPWAKLTASGRVFALKVDDTAADPTQQITVTLEGANFTGPVEWIVNDNLLRPVPVTGSGNSRTISIGGLNLNSTISNVLVTARTADGIEAVLKILVARNGPTIGDIAIEWGAIVDDGNKPEDNATVGAPPGTNVGTRPVEDLLEQLDVNSEDIIYQALRIDQTNEVLDARTFVDGQPVNTVFVTFRNEQITENGVVNSKLDLLGAKTPDGTAWNLNLNSVRISDSQTLAQKFTELGAADDDNRVVIEDLQEVVIGPDGSYARALVRLNNNGHITGFTQTNDGTEGSFIIQADQFYLIDPNGGIPIVPLRYSDNIWKMTNVEVDTLKINSVDTRAIVDNAVSQSNYSLLELYGASVGSDDDNVWRNFAYGGVSLYTVVNVPAFGADSTVTLIVTMIGRKTGGDNDRISIRAVRGDGVIISPSEHTNLIYEGGGNQVYTLPFFDPDPPIGNNSYTIQTRNLEGHPSWQRGIIIPLRLSK